MRSARKVCGEGSRNQEVGGNGSACNPYLVSTEVFENLLKGRIWWSALVNFLFEGCGFMEAELDLKDPGFIDAMPDLTWRLHSKTISRMLKLQDAVGSTVTKPCQGQPLK